MSGYTDYFLNSKFFSAALKTKNCGDNIRYKSNNNQSDINFLIENFNLDEFLKQTTRDIQPFYYAFFNTKMFLNFLREKIYFNKKNSKTKNQLENGKTTIEVKMILFSNHKINILERMNKKILNKNYIYILI